MTVYHKSLQILVTEIFIFKNDTAPNIITEVVALNETPYHLRSKSNRFTCRNVMTTFYGLLSIKHLASQIWELT